MNSLKNKIEILKGFKLTENSDNKNSQLQMLHIRTETILNGEIKWSWKKERKYIFLFYCIEK